jgi:hypothetical protein
VKLAYKLEEPSESDGSVKAKIAEGSRWGFKEGNDRYKWTAHGRDQYIKWWRNRLITTLVDIVPASDAIARAAKSSWWTWDDGSTPFHWRWPVHYKKVIRDGLKVYFQKDPPR